MSFFLIMLTALLPQDDNISLYFGSLEDQFVAHALSNVLKRRQDIFFFML